MESIRFLSRWASQAVREVLAVALVVSGGRVRAQARDALKELLDSPPTGEPKGCCHD
jgi:hypothetical protein